MRISSLKFLILIVSILLCYESGSFAGSAHAGQIVAQVILQPPFRHDIWQKVVSNSVDSVGQVDLKALRTSPKLLNDYLAQLERVSPVNHPEFFSSEDAELAYWINAHNAFALRLVLDAYPVDSLTEIPDFLIRKTYLLGGASYSLQEIRSYIAEHFGNIHETVFVLTDLTRTGPRLLNQAYEAESLRAQLRFQTLQYFHDPHHLLNHNASCGATLMTPLIAQSVQGTPPQNEETSSSSLKIEPFSSAGMVFGSSTINSVTMILDPPLKFPSWMTAYFPVDIRSANKDKQCKRIQLIQAEDKHLRELPR